MTRVLQGFIATSATLTTTLRVIPEPFTSLEAIALAGAAAATSVSLLSLFLITVKTAGTADC